MSELVDRQALKDYVSSLSTHPLNEWDTWGVLAAIDKQPTVAASPWHRVEEELPYENTDAIFYDENGYFHVGSMSRFRGYTELIDYDGNALHGVTHWMPVEPPKEKGE
jgi:hypothetical protein